MWIKRFLASSGFWIVAVYVLFYLITVLGFLWLLFAILGSEIEKDVKADIERQVAQIRANPAPLNAIAKDLIDKADDETDLYILIDRDGNTLASNYPGTINLQAGWMHLPNLSARTDPAPLDLKGDLARHSVSEHDRGYIGWVFNDAGYRIFVGRSLARIGETKQTLVRLALIVLPLTLFLATLVGIIFSRITTRRIEVINQQCRTIRQRGDVSLRIPNEKPDDEYGLLIANINAMLETIDRSIKNVQEVSDDVAHDLRTPLTRIKYSLETGLGKSDAPESELRGILETAVAETDRVLETFSAILRISQLNTGRRKARFQTFDVAVVARTIAEAYEPTADEKGHNLVINNAETMCLIHGDKDMIGQLLSNLIENCFEHAGDNLEINLDVNCTTETITLCVADNGSGIPGDEQTRIFDKFYRIDKSRSATGSGLGLAIVKAITDLHGGAVQVESGTPGTKFVVTLPRGEISGL